MAQLVLGIGSSHSPMVSLPGSDWVEWGKGDFKHPWLYTRDGRNVTYPEWVAEHGEPCAEVITPDACEAGAARVQAAVTQLQDTIERASLDVLVVIGDDQDEHLLASNRPPFLVYHGDSIGNSAAPDDNSPPMIKRLRSGYLEDGEDRNYAVASDLARHVIECAFTNDFDVATSDALPTADRGMGHAYGFVVRRLLRQPVPLVPIMLNTYNPPSQPRAVRCRNFGTMLRGAIDSWPADIRVGVVASGGLSHFIVLEQLDREVLDALARSDLDALTAIDERTWVSGTSEIKNWITTASVCHDRSFELIDYVPGYRTPAGTGTGLAFGVWR